LLEREAKWYVEVAEWKWYGVSIWIFLSIYQDLWKSMMQC